MPATSRWMAGIEYRGTAYSGWQAQPHAPSVQGVLETALGRVANHPIEIFAAGRTDAGVHAFQQVVHFDSEASRTPYAWLLGTNSNLPDDVSVRWVQAAAPGFHARFSATARRYRYVIHNARARSGLLASRAGWYKPDLDAAAMHRAAQALLGERDFSAFQDAECQSPTPMRNVMAVAVTRRDALVAVDIRANAFLHHMVRTIVGTLVEVGMGRQHEAWVAEVLASRDRIRAGENAPACGLYFLGAEYPAECAVPPAPDFWLP
ncbi:MAG TPA: tRNA pseudouridine(38-40) synthase TruA [Nevskiaceae bacterium]|nr:tRNA pseudouridine(38-40) synthase TruA [Nevskiaceae bacterium]